MKVISIYHRLIGFNSHHFNEADGFRREFARRGTRFALLVNAQAQSHIVTSLGAKPVFDDPTFRLEWSFEERTRRFVAQLHEHLDGIAKADDRVMLMTATQLETNALLHWLRERAHGKKPWIVILFHSDRWNRYGPEERERQLAEFRQVSESTASFGVDGARRVVVLATTELLARELSELLGMRVAVVPIPHNYGDPKVHRPAKRQSTLPQVAILGGTRREKGSHLIPEIIRACRAHVAVEFVVELANDNLSAEDVARLETIAGEPHVTVIRQPMTLSQYNVTLNTADIALFPYEVIPYRKRSSGVFGEAVAYGKPVVATPGTWMAQEIEAGRAAGTIADDVSPESIARAIARCVADLEPLRRSAQSSSAAWRKNDLRVFVDLVEEEIARRSAEEPRKRRWFSLIR